MCTSGHATTADELTDLVAPGKHSVALSTTRFRPSVSEPWARPPTAQLAHDPTRDPAATRGHDDVVTMSPVRGASRRPARRPPRRIPRSRTAASPPTASRSPSVAIVAITSTSRRPRRATRGQVRPMGRPPGGGPSWSTCGAPRSATARVPTAHSSSGLGAGRRGDVLGARRARRTPGRAGRARARAGGLRPTRGARRTGASRDAAGTTAGRPGRPPGPRGRGAPTGGPGRARRRPVRGRRRTGSAVAGTVPAVPAERADAGGVVVGRAGGRRGRLRRHVRLRGVRGATGLGGDPRVRLGSVACGSRTAAGMTSGRDDGCRVRLGRGDVVGGGAGPARAAWGRAPPVRADQGSLARRAAMPSKTRASASAGLGRASGSLASMTMTSSPSSGSTERGSGGTGSSRRATAMSTGVYGERAVPRDGLVRDDAQRVDVRGAGGGLAHGLLGREGTGPCP